MKSMNKLSELAEELYLSLSTQIEEPLKTQLLEDLASGEEGVVVSFTLKWAIETNTPISERLWSAISEYYAPLVTPGAEITRMRLSEVKHAA